MKLSRVCPAVSSVSLALVLLVVCASYGQTSEAIRRNLASHIVGMSAENHDGEKLGKVKDLILNFTTGEVDYALVASGGILGARPHLRIVPAPALSSATAKKNTLALDVGKVHWAAAPQFKKSELATLALPERKRQIYQFYGLKPDVRKSASASDQAPSQAGPKPTGREATKRARRKAGGLRLTSELVGRDVLERQQEKLGEVTDFLVSLSGDKPAFAIIAPAKAHKNDPAFAVALSAVSVTPQDKLLVDSTRPAFERAPRFDPSKWLAAGPESAPAICRFVDDEK